MIPLIINPLAEADLIEGKVWCDRYRRGTGIDFLLYVEDTFEQLRCNPQAFGFNSGIFGSHPFDRFHSPSLIESMESK